MINIFHLHLMTSDENKITTPSSVIIKMIKKINQQQCNTHVLKTVMGVKSPLDSIL